MKPTRPALGGELAPTRVVLPPAVRPAIAPSAVVRLSVVAGASALRVGNQLAVNADPIDLVLARAVAPLIAATARSARAAVSARVDRNTGVQASVDRALAVRELASAPVVLGAWVQVGPNTEAPVTAQVDSSPAALVRARVVPALATVLVAPNTEALVIAHLAPSAVTLGRAQAALITEAPASVELAPELEVLVGAQVGLPTEQLVSGRVAPARAMMLAAQSTEALASVDLAPGPEVLARAQVGLTTELARARVGPNIEALAIAPGAEALVNAQAVPSAQVRLAAREVMSAAVVPAVLSQLRGAEVRTVRVVQIGAHVGPPRIQQRTRAVLHAAISRIAKRVRAATFDVAPAGPARIVVREALIAEPVRHAKSNSVPM